MNKKIAIVFAAAIMLSSCALYNEYTQPVGTTDTAPVQTTAPSEPADITTILEEAPIALPAELKGIPLIVEGGKIVSYDVYEGRVIANIDDGNTIYISENISNTERFLDMLVARDAGELSFCLAAMNTNEAGNAILEQITVAGYEIKDVTAVITDYGDYSIYDVSVNAVLDVTESKNDKFPVGKNEYTIKSGDASSGVGAVSLKGTKLGEINFFSNEKPKSKASVCYAYLLDFSGETLTEEDINNDYFLSQCIMWNSDTNPEFTYEKGLSEEEFTAYINKSLGLNITDWSGYYNYDEYSTTNFTPPGRGRMWYYPLLEGENGDKVFITLYADSAYIIKARTYTFTVEENSDGTYCIANVECTEDFGIEPATGSV